MAAVQLRVVNGKHEGRVLALAPGRFVIGREEGCDLRPSSDMISRRHCAFSVTDEDVTLADLGSTNGTLVNETPIDGTVWLRHGDVVTVGTLKFELLFSDAPAAIPPGSQLPVESPVEPLTETSKEFRLDDERNRHTISLDDLAEIPPAADEPTAPVAAYRDDRPDPFAGMPAPPEAEIPAYQPPPLEAPPPAPPPVPPAAQQPPAAPAFPSPPAISPAPAPPAESHTPPTVAEPGYEEPPSRPKPNVEPPPIRLPDPSEVGVREEEGQGPGKRPRRKPPTREVNPSEQAADLLKQYAEVMQPKAKDD